MYALIICYLVIAWLLNLWPFDDGLSWLSNSYGYNVYFYWPNDKEEYLGTAKDLQACNSRAVAFAYSKKLTSPTWGYICCKITRTSSCAIKER